MGLEVRQGDILKIEHIKHSVLVLSKDFFNEFGEIIGCPIFENGTEGPLHIPIHTADVHGYAQCEKLTLLDLRTRGYKKIGSLSMYERMDIVDAVQGIFDYI